MRGHLLSRCWVAALLVVLSAMLFGCSPGETVALDDDADITQEVASPVDLAAELPPPDLPDLLEDNRDVPPTCPEEYEPCLWCKTVEDCDGHFTEVGLCEEVECNSEFDVCAIVPVAENTPCDDDDLCNGAESCRKGDGDAALECISDGPLLCADDDPCNGNESCDPLSGCVPGDAIDCDDGDLCNGLESCVTGEGCQDGEALECADDDPCNGEETCDPVEGCQDGEALVCSDDDACNGVETCVEGEGCFDGEALECDDGDPCNGTEACDAEAGCVEGASLECDDGNACNGLESCDADSGCILGKPPACGDNDVCNGTEECDPAVGCVDGAPLDCDDNNSCTDDVCFPASGCANFPNNNPGCCDSDADCDDGSPCTDDACNPGTKACQYVAAAGPCDDGDPCTAGDVCEASECVSGTALPNCSVVCTISGDAGSIVSCETGLARAADGNAPATTLDFSLSFEQSALVAVVDQVCPEGEDCTDISITAGGASLFESGHVIYFAPGDTQPWEGDVELSFLNPIDSAVAISPAWFDGNELLVGDGHLLGLKFKLAGDIPANQAVPVVLHSVTAGDAAGEELAIATVGGLIITADSGCGATLVHCLDGQQCTEDTCVPGNGSCLHEAKTGPCNDGNECTLNDFCDDTGECAPLNAAPAGTVCTGDDLCEEVGLCDGGGTCILDDGLSVVCPPAPSDCATYSCNRATGTCVLGSISIGAVCDDGVACTAEDGCDGSGGCSGTPVDCDDGLSCTADSCNEANGQCMNVPDGGLCDDDNPCTTDSCEVNGGCLNADLNAGACNDGDPCTMDDACSAGSCIGQWDAAKCGCDETADCAVLEDGNPCTGTFFCSEGSCVLAPNSVVTCPEYAGDCAFWDCDPNTGECVSENAPSGTECDAGGCLTNPACNDGGACVGSEADCDDGDECTTDACVPGQGCAHEALPDCESKFCICEVSGESGASVECPLLLVRESEGVGAPVGTDFKLQWDAGVLALDGFGDEVCMGPICLPKKIPTCQPGGTSCVWGSLYPSGHNIVAVPKQLVDWEDSGTLLLFHPGDPFKKLTDAWLSDGEVVGDPLYLTSQFTLQENVAADDPVCLWMAAPHFSLASGLTLDVKVETVDAGRAVVVY